MDNQLNPEIIFHHLVNLPQCACVYASTLEPKTGRRQLFLLDNEKRIFKRNAIKETWDQLMENEEYICVRSGFYEAIEERKIPCYQAQDLDVFLGGND